MRCLLCLALLIVPVAVLAAEPPPLPQPVREGNLERLVLDDGTEADAAAWSPAECTVSADAKHAKRGDTALLMHIDVDWKTGEIKYPVGWPRMNRKLPAELHDWSAWDYFDFSVYAESSRDSLPATPMGLGIYSTASKADYSRSLPELKLGQWVDFRLPLSALPSLNPRTGFQFHIAEANYRDGDKLDFWIDGISLARYVAPTLTASNLAEGAVFADAKYLLLDVDLMGVKAGEMAEVTWVLSKAGKPSAQGRLQAARGRSRVGLTLPAKGLAPGDYQLALQCTGGGPPPFSLKVVPSPWQEGSR
ncbi:MAG: hypothetical protein AUJ96_31925 [Armatimonadetes bacterium CG2_30_66_41]|nr:hypothetical protein [Armatimonadota bacterium]OIO92631.1 MAG: hypothetical protein AUJ96_31925 [Armatimonadetes bacterium CG2_30_66_41]PIU92688.1 MAG: hypothetical protein COS65_16585 [Armatimonadetes bacterium CG06_land_8_20_14_3_00_66_21]PJB69637.1 MAG: hypothetical protein CO096_12720 [Armatimonadetes bacterium CG_4_9_14_3_um_filter_66_14]NCQ28707.1 hypothetical protein [Armatimonadota bacterium]